MSENFERNELSVLRTEICGVGLVLTNSTDDVVKIAAICPGSPAACTGVIATGDEIVEVNGQPAKGLQASEIAVLLKGERLTIIRMVLKKSSPFNSIYHVLIARDKIGERDLLRLNTNISGSLGIHTTSQCTSKSRSWTLVDIEEGGSVWLAQANQRTGFGKIFQPSLQIGDCIEAINSTPVPALIASTHNFEGKAFSRVLLDVDRNGRKLVIDHILTPRLDSDSLRMAATRAATVHAFTVRLEAALSAGGLKAPSLPRLHLSVVADPHNNAPARNDGADPDQERRRSSACSDGWAAADGGFGEEYGSPRSFDSPRSTDSLDDVVLSLSQSVAPAPPYTPAWPDPRGDPAGQAPLVRKDSLLSLR